MRHDNAFVIGADNRVGLPVSDAAFCGDNRRPLIDIDAVRNQPAPRILALAPVRFRGDGGCCAVDVQGDRRAFRSSFLGWLEAGWALPGPAAEVSCPMPRPASRPRVPIVVVSETRVASACFPRPLQNIIALVTGPTAARAPIAVRKGNLLSALSVCDLPILKKWRRCSMHCRA